MSPKALKVQKAIEASREAMSADAGADDLRSWAKSYQDRDSELKMRVEQKLRGLRIKDQIVKIRKAKGLSQAGLCRLTGLSQPFIAKLESGQNINMELKTLGRLAAALDVPLHISLGDERVN